jgi:hypothetical protein
MESPTRGVLDDLFAAAESVCNHKGCGRSLTYGGEEDAFGEDLGNIEFFAFETKGAGHPAAARIEERNVGSRTTEEVQLGCHFVDGLVVAVSVKEDTLARERGGAVERRLVGEEIA